MAKLHRSFPRAVESLPALVAFTAEAFARLGARPGFRGEDERFAVTMTAQFALAYGNLVLYDGVCGLCNGVVRFVILPPPVR